jgi:SAM-dependent methyltransferase
MQDYSEAFARVYNTHWSVFATRVAPLIRGYYESLPRGPANKSVLDLCCGAGHLVSHFLEHGYRVVGIDLSEHMLGHARSNTEQYVKSGQAKFLKADASDFSIDDFVGLTVSTYDSLNHLESEDALSNCFRCVRAVCKGPFIFDLNTRKGLNNWNGTQVNESDPNAFVVSRGKYDGESDKAWLTVTGFVRGSDGSYQRFDESVFNTVFSLERVRELLLDAGWKNVHFARIQEPAIPVADPEEELRVLVIARP